MDDELLHTGIVMIRDDLPPALEWDRDRCMTPTPARAANVG